MADDARLLTPGISLDSRDADYEHFAPLFDTSGDLGPHSDPEECLVSGDQVVIIDRVRIAPAWRGPGGVGRLPIGRMLRRPAGRAAIVATHPYPIDVPVGERDDAAREARVHPPQSTADARRAACLPP